MSLSYAPYLASMGSQEKGLKPLRYPWEPCVFLCIACHSAQNPKGDKKIQCQNGVEEIKFGCDL